MSLGVWLILAAIAPAAEVTYTKDVAPILWKNCAGCHRPGDVGPFSLLTYDDAKKRADFIAKITAERRMPPWKPEPGFGHFLDERRLSEADLQCLASWAAEGAPEGRPEDLPPPPEFPTGDWQMGKPDLVLKMAEPFDVPADGRDVFRCFVIPMNLDKDVVVSGVEFHPGNRRVVHHALFFLDKSGKARKLDEAQPGYGYASFGGIGLIPSGGIGGWAPGAGIRHFPDGMGNLAQKGSDLVLQIHYHPDGKAETDQSELAVYYTRSKSPRIVAALMMGNRDIDIAPGSKRYRLAASVTLPADLQAVGVSPHMHWLGREMKLDATLPDGRVEHLLWIRDWDFNWQGQYLYRDLVSLPKGTRLDLEAFYDNSADNPSNPNDPPQAAHFGEQTTDEMCFCWLQFIAGSREDYYSTLGAGFRSIVAPAWTNLLKGKLDSLLQP
jgi:hypothetical protein